MNHYQILGVANDAGPDTIKQAYRKLASVHHPDRGGDTARFQEIQVAYDTLSDPGRRAQYDTELAGTNNHVRFTVNGHDMADHPDLAELMKSFGFNFGGDPFGKFRQPRRNQDIKIQVNVSLASTLETQAKTVVYQTKNGNSETVQVQLPRGVSTGNTIKYAGLGDNFFASLDRGDLYVVVAVEPDPRFHISGVDIMAVSDIDVCTAMLGSDIMVTGLDGQEFSLTLPPGTQPEQKFRIRGQGLWSLQGSTRGNLIVKITVTVPKSLTPEQQVLVSQLQSTL